MTFRSFRRVAVVLAGCVAVALAIGPAAGATSGTLVITSDTALTEDHFGDIVIEADDITLDCAGHTVSGPGTFGILLDGRRGVTVRNCRVTGFENGIIVVNWSGPSSHNTLTANTAFGNVYDGLALLGSSSNTVTLNIARENTYNGIIVADASNMNTLVGNTSTGNGGSGFELQDSNDNVSGVTTP